jgi:WXG100 family type VII secretion target
MSAARVRADYEQLRQIAGTFGQQAECTRQILAALQKQLETLQAGDWVGKSADTFYAEMTSAVLPAMGRVVAAMNEAATTAAKISQVMKRAEDDAAALFRLDGALAGTASKDPVDRGGWPDGTPSNLTGAAAEGSSAGAVSAFAGDRERSGTGGTGAGGEGSEKAKGTPAKDRPAQPKPAGDQAKSTVNDPSKSFEEKLAEFLIEFEKARRKPRQ